MVQRSSQPVTVARVLTSRVASAALRGIDPSSLAVFRILFGGLMVWEAYRYLSSGWVSAFWIEPAYRFTYRGFAWVPVPPDPVLYAGMGAVGVLGLLIALGVATRVSAGLLAFVFAYQFLLEATLYLNHFWLTILYAVLLAIVPTDGCWSLRAYRRGEFTSVPAWFLWVLRTQIGIVYVAAGFAKLQSDWLLGWPMRQWIPGSLSVPGLERFADTVWLAVVMSWGGLLFDLFIVPLLLWRRTRWFGVGFAIAFHALNRDMFGIGIFPYLGMAATLLFLDADWPRRLVVKLRVAASWPSKVTSAGSHPGVERAASRPVRIILVAWIVVMLILPLRPFIYPGEAMWTEEGIRLSWHMLLRSKVGDVHFVVERPRQPPERIDPRDHLTSRQYGKISSHPELIRQHAHHLREERSDDVRVRAIARVTARPTGPGTHRPGGRPCRGARSPASGGLDRALGTPLL